MILRKARNLLIIDFSCALIAGIAYVVLFDFLHEVLGLPLWVVYTQVIANNLYGIFGLFLFMTRRIHLFKVLTTMNFFYAIFCVGLVPILFLRGVNTGALLLLIEGLFIAILAKLEYNSTLSG